MQIVVLYHYFTSNIKTNVPLWAFSGLPGQAHVPKARTAALPTALQRSALREKPERDRAERRGVEGTLGAWVWSPGGKGAGNTICYVTEGKYRDRPFLLLTMILLNAPSYMQTGCSTAGTPAQSVT